MNKVELIGRLTSDPELRKTSNGTSVAGYTIALNDGYGENQKSVFVNITTWNKSAELVAKYCKKGQQIGIVGRLVNNEYESEGKTIRTLRVITDDIEFLGSKSTNEQKKDVEEPLEDFEGNKIYQDEIVVTDDDLPF